MMRVPIEKLSLEGEGGAMVAPEPGDTVEVPCIVRSVDGGFAMVEPVEGGYAEKPEMMGEEDEGEMIRKKLSEAPQGEMI